MKAFDGINHGKASVGQSPVGQVLGVTSEFSHSLLHKDALLSGLAVFGSARMLTLVLTEAQFGLDHFGPSLVVAPLGLPALGCIVPVN